MAFKEDALGLLASVAGLIPGFANQGIPFLPAVLDPFEPTGISVFAGGGGRARPGSAAFVSGANEDARRAALGLPPKRRRRRRRALTNDDMAAIAFIAGAVSKSAAGAFAVQLVARR